MAGTAPTEGGFLERMMRPTQSSAQKTHEKVEAKTSPPRKAPGSRVVSGAKPVPRRDGGDVKADNVTKQGQGGPDQSKIVTEKDTERASEAKGAGTTATPAGLTQEAGAQGAGTTTSTATLEETTKSAAVQA